MRANWPQSPTVPLLALCLGIGDFSELPLAVLQYGGLSFIVIYLICIALLVIPILLAESIIGDYWKLSVDNSISTILQKIFTTVKMPYLGRLGAYPILIINTLIIIAIMLPLGWCLYLGYAFLTSSIIDIDVWQSVSLFNDINTNHLALIVLMALAVTALMLLLIKNYMQAVQVGILLFFALLIGLILLIIMMDGTSQSTAYMEIKTITDLTLNQQWSMDYVISATQEAMKLAIISVAVGTGIVALIYNKTTVTNSLIRPLIIVIALDIIVSIIATWVIFRLLQQGELYASINWINVDAIQLLFVILPSIFSTIPTGLFIGFIFYLLLAISAVTTIAIIIIIIQSFNQGIKPLLITMATTLGVMLLLSRAFNIDSYGTIYPLLQDGVLLLISLLFVTSVGWGLIIDRIRLELADMSDAQITLCHIGARYIAPTLLAVLISMNFAQHLFYWLATNHFI